MLHQPLRRRAAAPGAALVLMLLVLAAPASPAMSIASAGLATAATAAPAAPAAPHGGAAASGVTLEMIMADPDWIGNPPERPYWADDGSAVYYEAKRQGSELRDLYVQKLAGGSPQVVADADRHAAETAGAAGGVISRDHKWRLFLRDEDVFVKELATGAVRQLTKTAEHKSEARFQADGRHVSYRAGNTFYVVDLETGEVSQPADLRLAKDPAVEDPQDFLKAEQLRLFLALREDRDNKKAARERSESLQRADPSRPPLPWYLGEKVKIEDVSLSPSGSWMVVVTRPKTGEDGQKGGGDQGQGQGGGAAGGRGRGAAMEAKKAMVPHWVTETGYVETKEIRPLVGTEDSSTQSLVLLDLVHHQRHNLDLSALPGIKDDPLKAMRAAAIERVKARFAAARAQAAAAGGAGGSVPAGAASGGSVPTGAAPTGGTGAAAGGKGAAETSGTGGGATGGADHDSVTGEAAEKAAIEKISLTGARPVRVFDIAWSDDGRHAAVELGSLDHKDRWIASVELDAGRLVPRHRVSDNAWISWDFNTIGWMPDNDTLYFESEESGHNQLYALAVRDGGIRPLTAGSFEVTAPRPSFDGRSLYYVANAKHPGQYDVWRLDMASGKSAQLTQLGGLTSFELSTDERQLLLVHSSIARHDELYVQENRPGAEARRITDTLSAAYQAQRWTIPDIVPIPSSHGAGAIYSRVYTPPPGTPAPRPGKLRPAVVFVHGAGYLQDAHYGWSYYFHEFMFHTFLTQHGYVVLDMDYRASAGYGRDWRTAIYRQMGHPELEDLADGIDWLVRNRGVDRTRVGVYGGSYGGFLTLMALFRTPDLFAAGAALRPVTDWSDYNDDYTGAILNVPELDPEAYDRSSPIEFADGLKRPLLICHGMVDDNVFFVDSARLVQRLIELKKENFDIAPFPVESHAFHRPTSWLNEYRRIWKLMSSNLQ